MEGIDPNMECSNGGCSVVYSKRNEDNECQYHPGNPVFHEGYKFWSCCKKKSIHFDEFLRQKGCTQGEHCWIPKEKPTLKESIEIPDIVQVEQVSRPKMNSIERPPVDSQMVNLPVNISPTFRYSNDSVSHNSETVQKSTCQNAGCSISLEESKTKPECKFHPGEAIFHEGLKYWSCCKKKAMDFDQFLSQVGCRTGDHCWITKKKQVDCRVDWHQTAGNVIVTLYAKNYSPSDVVVKGNPVKLEISIGLPTGICQKEWILHGIIDPTKSSVQLLTTKVEITLKKQILMQWTSFDVDGKM